jgi:hypothetical protein
MAGAYLVLPKLAYCQSTARSGVIRAIGGPRTIDGINGLF